MARNAWYSAGRAVIAAYARLMLDLDVVGREHAPAGPKLIVANHPSTSDPVWLTLLFQHPIDMLLIDSAFRVPLFGAYLRRAGQVCVTRDSGSAAFAQAKRRLETGRSVALFPEGNVTPYDGSRLLPRTGAARLAISTGVPVVPIGIYLPRERVRHVAATIGDRRLNGHWYLRGPYAATLGEAVCFEGRSDDAARVAQVSDAMMERITALANESERRLRSKRRIADR